ncbi:BREX-2 system phosphatase PglZ [Carbonactinospora thermoautotrophica]|uniref:BREX-2 system phosphatase PglZ n=1 Tax=Carbonactinospora thermoautotrophica TaxID=1469144 RepID=UPI003DA7AC06
MTTSTTITRVQPPAANRVVVEAEVRRARRRYPDAWVLLLRAAPEWHGPAEITVDQVTVRVVPCVSVLAVLDALTAHADGEYLVLLTPHDPHELGANVLARAAGHQVRPINRWDLVREGFGVKRLDPRLTHRQWAWVSEALLDAQPWWPKLGGAVLDLNTALSRLAAARLGRGHDQLDVASLLEWTRDEAAVGQFLELRPEERAGLTDWLESTVGPAAGVTFRLVNHGHAGDAIAIGLALSVLHVPEAARKQAAIQARVRAEERFFAGEAPSEAALRAFAEAAESVVVRWLDRDDSDRAAVSLVLDRAAEILAELRAGGLAGASTMLAAGFDARLAELADELARVLPVPCPVDLAPVEEALGRLKDHRLSKARAQDVEAAEMAVRLARWLTVDEPPPGTVADGALRHLRGWGWVDRALNTVWAADTSRVPQLAAAYQALYAAVRERRAELDRGFAERLAAWTAVSGVTDELLLAENLLNRIARPVAAKAAPLIVVLDGMTAAAATELAEDIAALGWLEVGRREDGRGPAVATVPSTTRYSRVSLLCGALRTGGQAEEQAGFREFWRGRRAVLFHKQHVRGDAAQYLDQDVRDAVADPGTVVGVVLNTIDDALQHGRESGAAGWRLDHIAYLRELLDAAQRAVRPVILTSDHGHVLDRGEDPGSEHADTARYRTGTPGPGEVLIRGSRVLVPGNEVVVPWEERIRYTSRRAGYHGGVSPAEMVIPVLVFVPSVSLCPSGWHEYDRKRHEPEWWRELATTSAQAPVPPAASRRKAQAAAPAQDEGLFDVAEVAHSGPSLGRRVASSELLAAQRAYARKAPPDDEIATLIDGLVEAGGKLPVPAVARLVGQPQMRMKGYLALATRLLNVDGYPVLTLVDGEQTVALSVELLKEQFLSGGDR